MKAGENNSDMSEQPQQIECRQCKEMIPLTAGNCPNCGASVRGVLAPAVIAILGAVVAVGSASNPGELWFYGLVGVLLVAIGSGLLYDRRRRIHEL